MTRGRRILALGLLVTSLTSCGTIWKEVTDPTPPAVKITAAHRSATEDGRPVRRVVVLPFQDLTGHEEIAVDLQRSLIDEIQKRQAFEIVATDRDGFTPRDSEHYFKTGLVRKETIVRLSKRYQADGVLYGALTRFHGYEPMSLGLQFTLVSAGAGDVIWSANSLFDTADQACVQDVRNYHDTHLADQNSLKGWRVVLLSPARFTDYACSRVVDTL